MLIDKNNLSSDQAIIALGMIACRALIDHGHFAARVTDAGVQIAHTDDIVDLLSLEESLSLQILAAITDDDESLIAHLKRRETRDIFPDASESADSQST